VAKDILTQHRLKLVQIAEGLIVKETIEGEELEALFEQPVTEPTPVPDIEQPAKTAE
jgi:ATP-dependent Zn protease